MQKDEINIIGMLNDIADDLEGFGDFFMIEYENKDAEERANDDVKRLDILIDYLKEKGGN